MSEEVVPYFTPCYTDTHEDHVLYEQEGHKSHSISVMLRNPPVVVYNSLRNEFDSLDSKVRITLRIQLSDSVAKLIEAKFHEFTGGNKIDSKKKSRGDTLDDDKVRKFDTEVLPIIIKSEILFFDGTVPYEYDQDSVGSQIALVEKLVKLPSIRYQYFPHLKQVAAKVSPRSIPISSSHGGRAFKLAFCIADQDLVATQSFCVYAKQPKKDAIHKKGGLRPRNAAARRSRNQQTAISMEDRLRALQYFKQGFHHQQPDVWQGAYHFLGTAACAVRLKHEEVQDMNQEKTASVPATRKRTASEALSRTGTTESHKTDYHGNATESSASSTRTGLQVSTEDAFSEPLHTSVYKRLRPEGFAWMPGHHTHGTVDAAPTKPNIGAHTGYSAPVEDGRSGPVENGYGMNTTNARDWRQVAGPVRQIQFSMDGGRRNQHASDHHFASSYMGTQEQTNHDAGSHLVNYDGPGNQFYPYKYMRNGGDCYSQSSYMQSTGQSTGHPPLMAPWNPIHSDPSYGHATHGIRDRTFKSPKLQEPDLAQRTHTARTPNQLPSATPHGFESKPFGANFDANLSVHNQQIPCRLQENVLQEEFEGSDRSDTSHLQGSLGTHSTDPQHLDLDHSYVGEWVEPNECVQLLEFYNSQSEFDPFSHNDSNFRYSSSSSAKSRSHGRCISLDRLPPNLQQIALKIIQGQRKFAGTKTKGVRTLAEDAELYLASVPLNESHKTGNTDIQNTSGNETSSSADSKNTDHIYSRGISATRLLSAKFAPVNVESMFSTNSKTLKSLVGLRLLPKQGLIPRSLSEARWIASSKMALNQTRSQSEHNSSQREQSSAAKDRRDSDSSSSNGMNEIEELQRYETDTKSINSNSDCNEEAAVVLASLGRA